MVDSNIKFPVLELTDWVFDGEKILEIDYDWSEPYHFKKRDLEKDLEKHRQRLIIDSNGNVLSITGHKIIGEQDNLFSFFSGSTLVVELDVALSGKTMSLAQVKTKILSRSFENFQITHNKVMTENEYNNKVKTAMSYEELFKIASFED